MRKNCLLILLMAISCLSWAQRNDSMYGKPPVTWKRLELAPRIALGTQRAFYLEGGLALQRYIYDARHGFAAHTYYAGVELVPAKETERSIYGIKIGAESVLNGGTGGIELKYMTNNDESDFVITPKIGLGLGVATLFYGYNFSTNKYPFERVRKHQFSLAINTHLFFYASKYENK